MAGTIRDASKPAETESRAMDMPAANRMSIEVAVEKDLAKATSKAVILTASAMK